MCIMDNENPAHNNSQDIVTQVKRWAIVLSFITFLVLEIYACYSISHSYEPNSELNPKKFSCSKNIDISNNLHVNICNKLINLFKNWNNTLKEVTLTDVEWYTLSHVLR
jgi:hypothetical protein